MASAPPSIPIASSFFGPRDDTAVTWLGMAGAAINARGTVVLIDPLLTCVERHGERVSETGHRFRVELPIEAKDVPKADAVLYTHADGDHFPEPTARTLNARCEPVFLAPSPVASELAAIGVEPARLQTARDFERHTIGNIEVRITPALHDWQQADPWRRGDCCGFFVKTPDGTVWHPGDTRLIDELLSVRGVDVLFFDVAAVHAHLGPAGSAKLAACCGAEVLLAYHYGTYEMPAGSYGGCDPADALPYVADLSARLLQPAPGQVIRLPLAPSGRPT